ncbi:uncharacterized protein LOC132707395 [Cylas formicarius]|uniref:uncharacterized protein LOC132707395 n=1 Tax=Cylas formicarius TaxID=197179 RepID=UPI002958D183|nr:uncharacterized protein LOC132707395 [Cylas formicarius]
MKTLAVLLGVLATSLAKPGNLGYNYQSPQSNLVIRQNLPPQILPQGQPQSLPPPVLPQTIPELQPSQPLPLSQYLPPQQLSIQQPAVQLRQEAPQLSFPSLPQGLPQLPQSLPQLPQFPQFSPQLPQFSQQLPQLPQISQQFPQISQQLPQVPLQLPQIPQQIPQLPLVRQQLPQPLPELKQPLPLLNEQINGPSLISTPLSSQPGVLVTKNIYVHVPPSEPQPLPQVLPAPAIRKNYKIIFIKAPEVQAAPIVRASSPLAGQSEEKTLVYVLVKKPEEPQIVVPSPAPTEPSKPEVYFIRYKAPGNGASAPLAPQQVDSGSNALPVVEDVARQGSPVRSGESSSVLFSGGVPGSKYGPPGYQK